MAQFFLTHSVYRKSFIALLWQVDNVLIEVGSLIQTGAILTCSYIQIVTGVEVAIGNCFHGVWKILPDAEGGR